MNITWTEKKLFQSCQLVFTSAPARIWIGQGDNAHKRALYTMQQDGNGVGDFPPTWAAMEGEGGGDQRFGGEGECLRCVFEWKYMMYCVPCENLNLCYPVQM